MDTTRSRSWDVAPLLLVGLAIGLVAPLLAGAGSALAAAVSLAGLVLLLTALVRWTRRSRERAKPAPVAPDSLTRVTGTV